MSTRILLVDDHRMLREGLRSILESQGDIEVVGEAEDGRAAVSMTQELVPDVVIMDIGMSCLNGVDATRQIKAQNPRVSVIALSMYSDKRYVFSMLEAGASGYVTKAAAFDEMRRAVRAVCGGRRCVAPAIAGLVIDAHRLWMSSSVTTGCSTRSRLPVCWRASTRRGAHRESRSRDLMLHGVTLHGDRPGFFSQA